MILQILPIFTIPTVMAIRAKIKLTNATDDELVNQGLLAPRLLRQIEAEGLVDTGAVSLVIPKAMATTLVQQGKSKK